MRMSASDIRAVRVFRSVVEHGGFSGAQLALAMSQSTISFQITALEQRLGFSLCQRGRRGFELTDRGRAVYDYSHSLTSALSSFEQQLGELRLRATGTLRIGIVDSTVTDSVLGIDDVIDQFVRKASEVDLRVTIGSPEQLIADIAKDGIDCAISPRIKLLPGYSQTEFHHEMNSLYCSERHPLFPKKIVTKADVEAAVVVVRPYANKTELQHIPNAKVGAYASNIEAQAMYILSGHYIGYLPDHMAAIFREKNRLKALLIPEAQIRSPFVIISPKHKKASLSQRIFLQELRKRIAAGVSNEAKPAVASKKDKT
ncbi:MULTISPECIES: LysR family transcriptional regulator [unclassified Mesorhizobium]|uniref:LysR family transcriptional regulator n=1 Tax=unclassified Mesorhizobium TaxID=325217 RepID=UPI00112DC78B|nr:MULTISPECIES: LysR family transcriptional regulator [unclassified Mesorhizobium]MBZ9811251.1 LysR family transcriptional regulator [Mesorhizobium sp. ESP-6-2]TPM25828.1 LysR family transcriptional regulator [Mesorhizobium sp. B2-2-2]